jgi:hypothetical protein
MDALRDKLPYILGGLGFLLIVIIMMSRRRPQAEVDIHVHPDAPDPNEEPEQVAFARPPEASDPPPSDPTQPTDRPVTQQEPEMASVNGFFRVRHIPGTESDRVEVLSKFAYGAGFEDPGNSCVQAYLMGDRPEISFAPWDRDSNPMRGFYDINDPTKCDMRRISLKTGAGKTLQYHVNEPWENVRGAKYLAVAETCDIARGLIGVRPGKAAGCFGIGRSPTEIFIRRSDGTIWSSSKNVAASSDNWPKLTAGYLPHKGFYAPLAFYAVSDPTRCEVQQLRHNSNDFSIGGKWTVLRDGEIVNVRQSCKTMTDVLQS